MIVKGLKSVNKNRGKLDIAQDMLTIASNKARKTRIMYQANLNCVQVEKYMKVLLNEGLLARDSDDGSYYLTTRKGHEFLRLYADYLERYRRLLEVVDDTLKCRLMLESMCFNTKDEINQSKFLKSALGF